MTRNMGMESNIKKYVPSDSGCGEGKEYCGCNKEPWHQQGCQDPLGDGTADKRANEALQDMIDKARMAERKTCQVQNGRKDVEQDAKLMNQLSRRKT